MIRVPIKQSSTKAECDYDLNSFRKGLRTSLGLIMLADSHQSAPFYIFRLARFNARIILLPATDGPGVNGPRLALYRGPTCSARLNFQPDVKQVLQGASTLPMSKRTSLDYLDLAPGRIIKRPNCPPGRAISDDLAAY